MQAERVIEHIVKWLRDYCENAGLNGFVVGVSGGIDSAVSSTLCAKTGKKVIPLSMPIYQAVGLKSLSEQHIQWLEKNYNNVKGLRIDLTPVFQALENTLPPDIQDGLSMANTQARLRMLTLYAVATHHRMLVAGTGNKVEDFGVGFFTKYGDGGVDISPIGDLMKSEVYEIGRKLGVLDAILHVPPTDGLWADNRTDESQIGASYEELEWAMRVSSGPVDESRLSDRQRQVLKIYRRFHDVNKHKMEPIPVCRIPEALR
ncbi:MAG: NAD(+) synthase [Deltaproteobacteria bacterium]|nr:NAD(+) synthase [Deltaproteobacteria bacterium]